MVLSCVLTTLQHVAQWVKAIDLDTRVRIILNFEHFKFDTSSFEMQVVYVSFGLCLTPVSVMPFLCFTWTNRASVIYHFWLTADSFYDSFCNHNLQIPVSSKAMEDNKSDIWSCCQSRSNYYTIGMSHTTNTLSRTKAYPHTATSSPNIHTLLFFIIRRECYFSCTSWQPIKQQASALRFPKLIAYPLLWLWGVVQKHCFLQLKVHFGVEK